MKVQKWLFSAIAIVLLKQSTSSKSRSKSKHAVRKNKELPLARSFAVTRSAKTLEDPKLGQEYIEQYQDMLKTSQESFENFDEHNDKRYLRRVIGDDDFGVMDEAAAGLPPQRRSAQRFQSMAGRRRARSQAVRRHKLNSQGMQSHMQHSKRTDQHSDEHTAEDIADLLELL